MNLRHVMITLLAGAVLVGSPVVFGDDDDHDGDPQRSGLSRRSADVAPVANPQYAAECGECHMVYSPELLPARSWRKLMSSLEDHFGDNAELPAETRDALTEYLVAHSAEQSNSHRSQKMLRSLSASDTPLRITETPYMRRKHDEVPDRFIAANDKVRSLSNCTACHTRAESGSFAEREIDIPGVGRWED